MAWSSNRCLNTCNDALHNKVRERLVGVSELESGGPIVLKKMLDSIMDIDNAKLISLTESLETLRIKDVAEDNVETVMNYLKGTLLLLKNCSAITTDTIGLLNDMMMLVDCTE